MSEHALVFKYVADGHRPCDTELLGWQLLESHGGNFRRFQAGPIAKLAADAIPWAIARSVDITVGAWGAFDPTTVAPGELDELLADLRPQVLLCPERSGTSERWIIAWDAGAPVSLPVEAMQAELEKMVERLFPRWIPRDIASWNSTCLMIRPGLSGEHLGLIQPEPLLGDRLLNAIASDPEVFAAFRAEDASLPETSAALAHARNAAQERRGIPSAERVFLHSGAIEGMLTPILLGMAMDDDLMICLKQGKNPGEKIPVLSLLRERLQQYGPLRDVVLQAALRDYPHQHPHLDRLREAAQAAAAAA
jgi:hypothetical protein